ncbi:Cytokinin-O-glucosyltransferase 3 [Hordeum vulgare]|nr:Cytokinin-O-glucosyltransferase 3 [Hordeum vulgare]
MHNAYAAMDPYWVKKPTAAPGFLRLPSYEKLAYAVERACADIYGVVLNTFLELEQGTVVDCVEVRNIAVWAVVPVSLFHHHEHAAALAARGNAPALDANECMQWLNGWVPSSVIYVSCGSSIVHADPKQLVEIGLGLSYVNGLRMTLGSSTPRYDDWDHAPNAIADPFTTADLFAMSTETIALNFKERTSVKERTLWRRLGRARCQAGSWIFIANKAADTQLDLHRQQG